MDVAFAGLHHVYGRFRRGDIDGIFGSNSFGEKIPVDGGGIYQESMVEVPMEEVSMDEVSLNDVSMDEVFKDEVSMDEVLKDEVLKDEVLKDEVLKDEVLKDEVLKDEVFKDEVSKDEVLKDDILKNEVLKDEVFKDEILKNELLNYEFLKGEILENEISMDEVPSDAEAENLSPDETSLETSETLKKISQLTSAAARLRLVARSLEMKMNEHGGGNEDFVPPKELLLYLVRMGSFSSSPKILNGDNQDSDIHIPEGISRQELLQFCQKQHLQTMVKRVFKKANDSQDNLINTLKFRKLNAVSRGCSDFISSPLCLRVFTWNVLSQALGQWNDNFARCPFEALEWYNRRYLMVEEILEYCPDIICLQEVDHFNFLKHILDTQGYSGMFFPKPDSPCYYIDGNNGPDGCAIFFRRNKFDLLKSDRKILEIWRVQSNQVALLSLLRIKETGQEVCVVTTHLKARNGALLSTLRNEQGKDLLQFVQSHCSDLPVVMCGDFNAEPTEPIYSTILNNPLSLSSAYADCSAQKHSNNPTEREPAYTTWKIREEGEVCHTIDYVFYSKDKMEVDAVLELPTGEEIGEDRVPSFSYPSDHFSLCCDFKLDGARTNASSPRNGLTNKSNNINGVSSNGLSKSSISQKSSPHESSPNNSHL